MSDAAVRPGVRIGVDVGTVRIGVAVSDPDGRLAVPAETLPRDASGAGELRRLAQLVEERGVVEVVVGLPVSLRGTVGAAARDIAGYARQLATAVHPVPVRLVDERFTTVHADRRLQSAGLAGRQRRAVVDQLAAAILLQDALDAERATGRPPGRLVTPAEPDDTAAARRREAG